MKIGYRRLSGAIGLSDQEAGTRGMWWEKRLALLSYLEGRGHEVSLLSRPSAATRDIQHWLPWDLEHEQDYDLLFVEFGGSNPVFFKDDLEMTYSMIAGHRGKVVFICDDPDLWFPWDALPGENWARWVVLANASGPRELFPVPAKAMVLDFPISGLMSTRSPNTPEGDKLVYVGRPSGRERAVKRLIAGQAPWRVYGRQEEWDKLGVRVHQAPAQPQRSAFYGRQRGALVLADAKHKAMRWRTGRAYHAVSAGCPSVVEADHLGLAGFATFRTPEDLKRLHQSWAVSDARASAVLAEQALMRGDKHRVDRVFQLLDL